MKNCTSCNVEVVTNYTSFKCPKCGHGKIVRCDRCKTTIKKYKCPECKFIGP